jgi:hypothetical protein
MAAIRSTDNADALGKSWMVIKFASITFPSIEVLGLPRKLPLAVT